MSDLHITCPHCNMQITFGIGSDSDNQNGGELLGFVFTCPSCHTPVSYQAREDAAVEMDKTAFNNFQRAVEKKINEAERLRGAAFTRQGKTVVQRAMDEGMFNNMLRNIRECDSYDDFLNKI